MAGNVKWRAFNKEPSVLTLYGYWRSSASWRLRWALHLKEIPFQYVPVNLLKGENKSPAHLKRHPLGAVPVLELNQEEVFLHESLAILEWIEEIYQLKGPSFFPGNALERAKIRSLCEVINSSTAPYQTPKVQKRHSPDTVEQKKWAQDFIREGLTFYDYLSRPLRGEFSVYDQLSAADLFLVPQIYNAIRYEIQVQDDFPDLFKIYEKCLKTPACAKSAPESQVDCPKTA